MKNKKHIYLIILYCFLSVAANAQQKDWTQINRYEQDNKRLSQEPNNGKRIVFLGNSITEGWVNKHPDFFTSNQYIGRGISGQTSYQFLARFREDVINLHPALVIINAGTNDVAENTRPYNEDYTFGNIVSLVELARANKIKVILTSVLPAGGFSWNPSITNASAKIQSLNAKIKEYAKVQKLPYVDYYSAFKNGDNALNQVYTQDGVHPTLEGYLVMEPLIQTAIKKIVK